jgi:hypothetical protein
LGELVETPGYRLWQSWQQMHYPIRGLPESEAARFDLLAIDGIAGPVLEHRFCARLRGDDVSHDWRGVLEQCDLDLDRLSTELTSDASRYFARLHTLMGIALHGDTRDDGNLDEQRQKRNPS